MSDRETVDWLLTTTRAVRRRLDLDRPVEREVIEECIELAIQAPTGSNSQGWRWLVVTDPAKRQAIADAYNASWGLYRDAGRAALPNDERAAQQERVLRSADHLAENLHRVPVHVIPCLLGQIPPGIDAGTAAGFFGSIFPAVWSFQLALRSRGLGSVLTTLHLPRQAQVAELLDIPETVTQSCLLPVAYTKGNDFKPATRRPAREITYWDSWKSTR